MDFHSTESPSSSSSSSIIIIIIIINNVRRLKNKNIGAVQMSNTLKKRKLKHKSKGVGLSFVTVYRWCSMKFIWYW